MPLQLYFSCNSKSGIETFILHIFRHCIFGVACKHKPEDQWSCIAHLSAEDMLKSAVIEAKKFKHSPWAGADNPLGPNF